MWLLIVLNLLLFGLFYLLIYKGRPSSAGPMFTADDAHMLEQGGDDELRERLEELPKEDGV